MSQRTKDLLGWLVSITRIPLSLAGALFALQVFDRILGSGSKETVTSLVILVTLCAALLGTFVYFTHKLRIKLFGEDLRAAKKSASADLIASTLLVAAAALVHPFTAIQVFAALVLGLIIGNLSLTTILVSAWIFSSFGQGFLSFMILDGAITSGAFMLIHFLSLWTMVIGIAFRSAKSNKVS